MKTERIRLTLAPRNIILSRLNKTKTAMSCNSMESILANKPGAFYPDIEDIPVMLNGDIVNPIISDGDIIHWYGLISDVNSLMTSITSVFVNFKREYILYTDTGKDDTSVTKIIEIIIDFDGVEVTNDIKEAVQNVATLLLNEYNPKVV